MKKRTIVALCVMAMLVVAAGLAQADDNKFAVQITGKNVNLVKTLCGEDAPAKDVNALVVTEAVDADGKAIEGMAGKVVHYLPSDAAKGLCSGDANLNKTVVVKGDLYKNAQAVTVASFEVKEEKAAEGGSGAADEWDELGVTTMSQQAVI